MRDRRASIQSLALLGVGTFLGCSDRAFAMTHGKGAWFMPDESEPH